jgi:RNA polymerase sigma-70 factor (ECF subfamily)
VEDELFLISKSQSGDRAAFDRLMVIHMDRVYRVAWQVLHDRDDAMDATQEVFIRLHRALPTLGQVRSLQARLCRVCLNYCFDRKRSPDTAVHTLSDEEWDGLRGDENAEPQWLAEHTELAIDIRRAVDELSKMQRAAFILRHYEQLSVDEIGQALGCKAGTVKCHLSRATASLRDKLRERIGYSPRKAELEAQSKRRPTHDLEG